MGSIATGDPTFCVKCKSIFNSKSKIVHEKNSEEEKAQIWYCEFCYSKNEVNLDDGEIPTQNEVNYILEGPTVVQEEKKGDSSNSKSNDTKTVIFCIDTSSSMGYI
jgi:hypothetical protein